MRSAGLIAILLLAAGTAHAATREQSLELGGSKRWWLEHEPAVSVSSAPRALVLVLHGGGGTPEGAERMSEMSELADREGFLAVYPAGTGRFGRHLLTWNSGNCCAYAMNQGVDDTAFLSALIDRLVSEGRADPARVFATGLSNGAMMAHRLGCEAADKVAAIAPVAGAVGVPDCRPARPVSVLMIQGRADEHVPYEGGAGRKALVPRTDRSAAENARLWREADGCDASGERCKDGTQVRLITHGGGHIWPGGKPGPRNGNVDPVLPEPKATQVIWEFFKRHGRGGKR
jgi:polyhydroxybutyrate depolymerase